MGNERHVPVFEEGLGPSPATPRLKLPVATVALRARLALPPAGLGHAAVLLLFGLVDIGLFAARVWWVLGWASPGGGRWFARTVHVFPCASVRVCCLVLPPHARSWERETLRGLPPPEVTKLVL